MARTVVEISIELDPISDALQDIQRAHDALTRKHGSLYRQLERDIETLLDHLGSLPELEYLGEGMFIVRPPCQVTNVLKRARALRVI